MRRAETVGDPGLEAENLLTDLEGGPEPEEEPVRGWGGGEGGGNVAAASGSVMAAAVMVNSNGNSGQPSSSSSLNGVAAAEEGQSSAPASGENGEEEPVVDIVINNVVCSFNVRCHLNLRDIALRGLNVEYRKENGVRQGAKKNAHQYIYIF